MPFAAVISPGSLSTALNETQRIEFEQVPQPLFTNRTPFTVLTETGSAIGKSSISEFKASTELWQLALSVGASGQRALLFAPYRNMTYHYRFDAPAIKCMAVANVTELTNTLSVTQQGNLTSGNYTSWVPGGELSGTSPKTFDPTENETLGAGIYIATGSGLGYSQEPARDSNTNVTECRLHRGSYDVLFEFRYPEQNLTLLDLTYGLPMAVNGRDVDDITDWTPISYAGVMEAFGRLLVGSISDVAPGATGRQRTEQQNSSTSAGILHIDWNEAETARTALEQLFQNITLSLLSRNNFM